MILIILTILCFFASPIYADELTHTFKNPSFSGKGYSSHVLTIENLQHTRKAKVKSDRGVEERRAQREADNTNLAKFIRNVESRIYSQISKNLVDKMFGEEASDTGEVTIDGNTISYSKTNTSITMTIVDSNGSTTTMTIPIGEFTF
tara:strand:- start:5554 stop:5994 length:441 start_codon:yes stop_codon:yes gene_type:complete